jgi:flagellin
VETIGKAIDGLKGQITAARELYAGAKQAYAQNTSYVALSAVQGDGLWFQTGANSMQGIAVAVGGVTTNILGIGYGHGESSINVNTDKAIEISSYINIVDDALLYVTSQRAMLGAVQNRMEYTKNSLDVSSENLSASESRIRDTDMGKEMMKLTAANILSQSGVSMLAQANQNPQNVLQLLR